MRRFSFVVVVTTAVLGPLHAACAEHFMDKWPHCPAEDKVGGGPLCPPPEALIWTQCPAKWPLDKNISFYAATPSSGVSSLPFISRYEMNEDSPPVRLDCVYGKPDTKYRYHYHLTIEPPLPVIQCTDRNADEDTTRGCSSPKPDGPIPPTPIYIAEPLTDQTTLEGIGLGWTVDQVNAFAQANGYSTHWAYNHIAPSLVSEGLYRQGTAITVIYDESTPRKSKEVILNAGWQDGDGEALYEWAVRKLGLGWDWVYGIEGRNDPKYVWSSPDTNVIVEYWPDFRPKATASLHLIDKHASN